jgi:outer membrane lipoprotein SlyB
MRFSFLFALAAVCAAAPLPAAEPLLDGVVEQTIDLPIADAAHHGVAAIVGMGMPLGTGDLVGEGSAVDVARAASALAGKAKAAPADAKASYPGVGARIVVRLSNGVLVVVLQPSQPRAFVGQSVRIEGGGNAARVVGRKAP